MISIVNLFLKDIIIDNHNNIEFKSELSLDLNIYHSSYMGLICLIIKFTIYKEIYLSPIFIAYLQKIFKKFLKICLFTPYSMKLIYHPLKYSFTP